MLYYMIDTNFCSNLLSLQMSFVQNQPHSLQIPFQISKYSLYTILFPY